MNRNQMAWEILLKFIENPESVKEIVRPDETAIQVAIDIADKFLDELNRAEIKRTYISENKKEIE